MVTESQAIAGAIPQRRQLGRVVVSWITTTDHKTIGYLYLVTSFIFFLIGGVMALLIRAELFAPGIQIVSNSSTTSCSRCTARSCCCSSRRRCSRASRT